MRYFSVLFLLLGLVQVSLASTLQERSAITFQRITQSVRESQLPSGEWLGVIEADPSVDLMPLVLAKNLGLSYPNLEEETLERIFKRQDSNTGLWSEYPGGPQNFDVTGSIILTLKYLGFSESDPRLIRAWAWFNDQGSRHKDLGAGNRLIGVMGKWLSPKLFIQVSPNFMAVPKAIPINIHTIGFTRMALIPYTIWGFYREAKRKQQKIVPLDKARIASRGELFAKPNHDLFSNTAEFWAQEGIGWLLDRQQADGTWGGALQMTYFTMLALQEAQLAGVGDFTPQIQKAWKGLMSWRAKIPEGSVIQQSTVGPVMDTARILSAIESAPRELGLLALPNENRERAVTWLLDQQITKKGDWSNLLPELAPGGWTFEYFNDFNPDSDDTAMALEGLAKSDLSHSPNGKAVVERGVTWLTGLQNKDGGFPAWDRGVTPWLKRGLKLAHAPEMSDGSQVDITSRSIKAMVAVQTAFPNSEMSSLVMAPIKNACRFLEKQREKTSDSSLRLWRGEWMTNYLYGTSEAIGALLVGGCWSPEKARPYIDWLITKQQQDGGWGESPESYTQNTYVEARSTLSQSEWVLSMLTVYENMRVQNSKKLPSVMPDIENGISFLLDRMGDEKFPHETEFTGTFVRGVWYSRYVSLAHYEGIRALGGYLSLSSFE